MSDWHAIVVDGGEPALRGFISGFVGDRGVDPTRVLLAQDLGVHDESFGERLLDLLRLGRHNVVLVPDDLADVFVAALVSAGHEAGLKTIERHRVQGAHFDFSVETFSRDVATQVQAVLAAAPAGVTVPNLDEKAETHDDEKGLTMFVPGHAYAYRASGRVTGPLEGVLAVRRGLERIEAATLGPLHLDLAR